MYTTMCSLQDGILKHLLNSQPKLDTTYVREGIIEERGPSFQLIVIVLRSTWTANKDVSIE
jgi:hypothetical protein